MSLRANCRQPCSRSISRSLQVPPINIQWPYSTQWEVETNEDQYEESGRVLSSFACSNRASVMERARDPQRCGEEYAYAIGQLVRMGSANGYWFPQSLTLPSDRESVLARQEWLGLPQPLKIDHNSDYLLDQPRPLLLLYYSWIPYLYPTPKCLKTNRRRFQSIITDTSLECLDLRPLKHMRQWINKRPNTMIIAHHHAEASHFPLISNSPNGLAYSVASIKLSELVTPYLALLYHPLRVIVRPSKTLGSL